MTETDHELDADAMARLRDGEDLALNELMNRWRTPLARFLYRYTMSEADALDLAQATFVRVYEHRGKYDDRAKFSTWLFTIAANLARNHARDRARRPTVSLETPTSEDGAGTLEDQLADRRKTPAEEAVRDELVDAVRSAIEELPEDQRLATILFEYEEQSQAEIATVLHCSEKAVEARLYRARQFLREKLRRWLKAV
jgi:RNA polymerase sigma-70 factor (ECF subfamily)